MHIIKLYKNMIFAVLACVSFLCACVSAQHRTAHVEPSDFCHPQPLAARRSIEFFPACGISKPTRWASRHPPAGS